MTTPTNNNTDVSFPTFVRLNIETLGLNEEKKKKAVMISEMLTANDMDITQDLTSSTAKLECKQDLIARGNFKITNPQSDIFFNGRVNLADNTVDYKLSSNNQPVSFTEINSRQGKQYVPYGLYKIGEPKVSMRSATSSGHVGSGDTGGGGAEVLWDAYNEVMKDTQDEAVSLDSSHRGKLFFTASPEAPILFRLSVFLRKSGAWLDNGVGGPVSLYANTYEVGGKVVRRILGTAVCYGSTWYTTVPMFWCAATYYATSMGYFQLIVEQRNFRVASFSWNVVRLPFVP
ncbi:hypothetical protein C6H88_02155 [Chlamydia muridarum str. Nigg]|uniref:Uncharacterized protein n=2 Tax=Chlamydia muridarum TaxID=83560 RepID=A0A069ZXV6_CHLMR|nr:hypothetical protein [Chlamydia muridarum]UFT29171.1 hypothetical protein FTN71_02240 [Chlamydia trachomatis]AAF39277.1 conserved hypothetical protein [Chlamydia muridarum str. Nigg]AHH22805.1 hypothetical protein TAC_02185 [Chlamydia muridarum str. Nigg3 CMUT3-5]AHH23730.1 hypothetical protein Y015_02185 [Chlamydia muridarum str. Nigg CM972]AID37944.1 hypothetical protein BB17_02225 [Chlamydia muridarum str. Nigg 2 MCR]